MDDREGMEYTVLDKRLMIRGADFSKDKLNNFKKEYGDLNKNRI